MFKFFFIICLFFFNPVKSQEFKLVCSEKNRSFDSSFRPSFSKIVNFEKQTLFNYSGGFFDDVILFGRNEIILENKIFNTRSTFNINTKLWTMYKGQFIKTYKCSKKERRF